MDRRRSIAIAAAGVGAAIALVIVGRGGPAASELQAAAADLDGRIRETATAAQVRAQTLAELPRLSWAVATDEQTMLDLTADELAFQPAQGELIEIGQVQRRDGAVTRLRRVGDGTTLQLPLGEIGSQLLGSDGKLHVASMVSVEPKTRADQIRGSVGVSRTVDTASLAVRLRHAGFALRVELPGGGSVVVGNKPLGAHAEALTLYADAARGAKLSALAPAGGLPSLTFVLLAIVVFVASLVAAGLTWRRAATAVAPDDPPLRDLVPEVHIDLRKRPPQR
ncbi:MAG TPA: hypothetical protein VGL86_03670 [Polyangia bacterium]